MECVMSPGASSLMLAGGQDKTASPMAPPGPGMPSHLTPAMPLHMLCTLPGKLCSMCPLCHLSLLLLILYQRQDLAYIPPPPGNLP